MGVICKYKYDSSIYADLIPEFNSGYSGYVITDEVEGNIITRTIESDELPTLMRFGNTYDSNLGATNITNSLVEVIEIDCSEITTAHSMFANCTNLTKVILNNFNKINDMHDMFYKCQSLIFCNTTNWNTSNVTDMIGTFYNCNKLTSLDLSNFDTSNVTSMQTMFYNCDDLTSLDVSNFNTNNVTNMVSMFHNCKNLTSLDVSNFNTSNAISMYNMFCGCNKLTTLNVSNWNTSNVTSMQQMFNNCNNLTSLDVSNWNTSNVESMYQMFQDCSNLTSLDVSGFNTGKVIHMGSMFYNCSNLTSLDVSGFDTSNVNYMHYMFTYCSKLTNLDLSDFDTSSVTRMEFMFCNCSNLTNLDLSGFDTSKVTNTTNMFINTNSLEVITMFNSNINTINVVSNLTSATIYVDESLDQSQYTGAVPLKVYKEEKLEIKLSSPLLEEDTIEVIDGKLCHVHRYEKVVLNGSEDETFITVVDTSREYRGTVTFVGMELPDAFADNTKCTVTCDRFTSIPGNTYDYQKESIYMYQSPSYRHNRVYFHIYTNKLSATTFEAIKQWLQQNPTTVVYELAEPYYEDITPLQSSIILKTFLESSMTIDTILPIETKLSYRTNVPSISTLSTRATELAESDNVIHNLMNIIDDEVDE